MKNDAILATANPVPASQTLRERLLNLSDNDLRTMQGGGAAAGDARTFDNGFNNGFKNIAS